MSSEVAGLIATFLFSRSGRGRKYQRPGAPACGLDRRGGVRRPVLRSMTDWVFPGTWREQRAESEFKQCPARRRSTGGSRRERRA